MKFSLTIIIMIGAILFLPMAATAQQGVKPCKNEAIYENKNQIDPEALYLKEVSGRVVAETGEELRDSKEIGAVPNACLFLFRDNDHRLIAQVVADGEGRFELRNVVLGNYRLVVRAKGLCTANARVKIVSRRRNQRGHRLVIHMRPSGYDSCSYADYK